MAGSAFRLAMGLDPDTTAEPKPTPPAAPIPKPHHNIHKKKGRKHDSYVQCYHCGQWGHRQWNCPKVWMHPYANQPLPPVPGMYPNPDWSGQPVAPPFPMIPTPLANMPGPQFYGPPQMAMPTQMTQPLPQIPLPMPGGGEGGSKFFASLRLHSPRATNRG